MLLGKNALDSDAYLDSQAIDTFTLETYTHVEDSLASSNLSTALLGSYNDPVTGIFESEIYTQLQLSALSPEFGDISAIKIDSFVLGMEYRGYYGKPDPQYFEVYQMQEGISRDSTYYSFTTKAVASQDLVQTGKNIVVPDTDNPTIIDGREVDAQLRLHLDTNFARNLITEADNNPATFESNENFLAYFKGLNIKVNNSSQAPGEGAILYFNLYDPLSKLTIYYTADDGQKKTFDFLINDECANFNHITINNSPAVQQVIDNPALGQGQFFAQANKSRAVIKFTTLGQIPKNAVIQYAKLELPVSSYTYDVFYPSPQITSATRISASDPNLYSLNQIAEFSGDQKNYVLDVRDYVQQVVNQQIENMGIYLSPSKMLTSAERIVFNGTNSTNKKQPKLKIIYTTY